MSEFPSLMLGGVDLSDRVRGIEFKRDNTERCYEASITVDIPAHLMYYIFKPLSGVWDSDDGDEEDRE